MREKRARYFCHSRPRKREDGKSACLLTVLFILFTSLFPASTLYAQESSDLVLELVNRVAALEAEQRELRGHLDEAHHELLL